MPKSKKSETDYENPIEIAEWIYWVGFYDRHYPRSDQGPAVSALRSRSLGQYSEF
jgi:hypothetical protein